MPGPRKIVRRKTKTANGRRKAKSGTRAGTRSMSAKGRRSTLTLKQGGRGGIGEARALSALKKTVVDRFDRVERGINTTHGDMKVIGDRLAALEKRLG